MEEEVTYADIKFSKIPGEEVTGVPNSAAASTPPASKAVPPVQSSSRSSVIFALGAAVCILLLAVIGMGIAILLCHNHSNPDDARKPLQQCASDLSKYKNDIRKTFCVDPNTGKEAEPCELCPEGWKKGCNGSCYFISTEPKSWDSANESCSKLGAHLAMIEDKEELKTMESATRRGFYYWIGLSRKGGDWKWRWVDNTQLDEKKVSFTPNQNENCACMYYGSLHPGYCHSTYQWICEQEAVRV